MSTPVLTAHARQRCEEMGISTKVAKRIVQNPTCDYPAPPAYPGRRRMVSSVVHPAYLVIVDVTDPEEPLIVTVLLKSDDDIPREEANARARALLDGPSGH